MGEFFGSLYTSLFENFFGLPLAEYLWGDTTDDGRNLYIGVGLWMIALSLLVAVLYYYIINHPKLARWWGWLIFAGISAVVNFFVGLQWTLSDYYAGKMVEIDAATNQEIPLSIDVSNCLCFGVSNAILSLVFFIIFSILIKWKSVNCSHVPF